VNEAPVERRSWILDTVDEFIAAVPWTKNRMVLVYQRHHGGRRYVRLRTFNRHKTKGWWYPSPRFFVVPQECATDLAKAINAAAMGKRFGPEPDWYQDFEKQYAGYCGAKEAASDREIDSDEAEAA